MKFIGNILWLIFGGLESAIGYFTGSIALMVTVIGIPWGLQTLKLGMLCLWPFGAEVRDSGSPSGCLCGLLNVIWWFTGGLGAFLSHLFFGVLLCITVIGIPFGCQHFKLAGLALMPFGKDVVL